MNRESFLELMTGRFLDGTDVKSVSLEKRLLKSVGDHIHHLFNTKQGSLSHLPSYGIPDTARLYRGLPGSLENLKSILTNLIKKYEPRLERVQIKSLPFDPLNMRIDFVLQGYLKSGGAVMYSAGILSNGRVTINYHGRAN